MGTSTAWVWIVKLLWKDADWIIMFDAWSEWIWRDIFIASLLIGLMLVITGLPDGWAIGNKSKSISFLNFGSILSIRTGKVQNASTQSDSSGVLLMLYFSSKSFKFKSVEKILLDWPTVRELDACDTIKIRFGWSYCCPHVIQAFINLQFFYSSFTSDANHSVWYEKEKWMDQVNSHEPISTICERTNILITVACSIFHSFN